MAVVSILPRIDLRPPTTPPTGEAYRDGTPSVPTSFASASAAQVVTAEPAISQVGWTAIDLKNGEATRATSYYEPTGAPPAASPQTGSFATQTPLSSTANLGSDPKYVVDRLDRASQQLVNSVGTTVSNATSNWLPSQSPASASTTRPPPAQRPPRLRSRGPGCGISGLKHHCPPPFAAAANSSLRSTSQPSAQASNRTACGLATGMTVAA